MEATLLASQKDSHALRRLKQAIAAGNVISFVGAGLAMRAGFSNWDDLLDEIAGQKPGRPATRQATDLADLSWRAEAIRAEAPERRYEKYLRQYFGRKPKRDDGVDALARLNVRHVFTTNYDRSLELAMRANGPSELERLNWQLPNVPSEVMHTFGTSNDGKRHLVYLHGRFDSPDRIVLSERDYRDTYVRSDETVRKLFAIFSMRQVAFFGFSLRDLDVLSIFRQVRASNPHAHHFAVMPDPTSGAAEREWSRDRYINKFGIHPIYYLPGGHDHPNFTEVVESLAPAGSRPRRPAAEKAIGDTYAASRSFRDLRGLADPDDPQKGRFGGKAVNPEAGRALRAVVTSSRKAPDWFDVEITVSTTGGKSLSGKVDLWVHDSFPQEHYWTFAKNGVAKFTFTVWGSFTVGATCDAGKTPLELDLATVKGPRGWPRD